MLLHSAAPVGRRSLLELDPELGAQLTPEQFAQARSLLVVDVIELDDDCAWIERHQPDGAGLLVVSGVLSRAIVSGNAVAATELLGPGDLLRPRHDEEEDLLALDVRCEALSLVHAAVLDRAATQRLARWPELSAVLLDRVSERAHRLAVMQAISQLTGVERRLHALFWHLAARFGRVTADGVVLSLALSHRRLGELVGARRPTVSTALGLLARYGCVRRRSDGAWLLSGGPPQRLATDALAKPA